MIDANGTNRRTISPALPAGTTYQSPDLSPDGSELAFTTAYGQLYVMNIESGGLTRLASGIAVNWARWSPDGSQIAFSGLEGNNPSTIWTVNANGSDEAEVIGDGATEPSWSPDGKWLAYNEGVNIFIVPSTGGQPTQLTDNLQIGGEPCNCGSSPAWSPNQAYIAYVVNDYPFLSGVVVITAIGGVEVGGVNSVTSEVSWSPDGQRLLLAPSVVPSGGGGIYSAMTGVYEGPDPVGNDANWIRVAATAGWCRGGYRLAGSDGGVFAYGHDAFLGSMGGTHLNAPIVGMAATTDDDGYWLVASDGGVFSFGEAAFHGSMGASPLREPVVGMAEDPATDGYWLVAADGGVFSFDAPFLGSMGNTALSAPVVGLAATPDGNGYWLVGADGGVFAFGDAKFDGSMGGTLLDAAVTGIAPTQDGDGYWLVGSDGGIFAFGDAAYLGNDVGGSIPDVVGIARDVSGDGYLLVGSNGHVAALGDDQFCGAPGGGTNAPLTGGSS